jgi:hypothetical protein
MSTVSDMFSVLSAASMVSVFLLYLRQVRRGESTPNPVTWSIWAVMFVLNTATYFFVAGNDMMKVIQSGLATILIFVTVVYVLVKKGFAKTDKKTDYVCLTLAVIFGIFWWLSGDEIITNLLLQITFAISFIPTLSGIMKGTGKEAFLSWTMAVVSYVFLIIALATDPNPEKCRWFLFVFPVVNGIMGNGSIALLALLKRHNMLGKPALP